MDVGIANPGGISSVGPKEGVDSSLRVNLVSNWEDLRVCVSCMLLPLVLPYQYSDCFLHQHNLQVTNLHWVPGTV